MVETLRRPRQIGGASVARGEVEAALEEWRAAQRRLEHSTNGDRDALEVAVNAARDKFQKLSADHMLERIDALQDAEERRQQATPSTPDYHEAAREETEIAADIWESAARNDQETPDSASND